MSYRSATIAEILGKLNHTYFLPAIQRPFVWEPEQVIRLFDSLMQGYPISSFLFWDLKAENRDNWEVYKFIQNFKFGEIHDEKVDAHGGDITLVLDGQQRLTSLLVGIKGTYTVRMKYQRKANPCAWVRQTLYLNLLKDPRPDGVEEEDYFEDISYGFKFFSEESSPKNSQNQVWFRVERILACSDHDVFDYLVEEVLNEAGEITPEQRKCLRRNLERLYRVIWREETIAYYTEASQSYDKVLDIFIRANDGGTKLSKSDLLMSMVTLKWSSLNARDEINQLVTHLNTKLDSENNLDRDFVLRSSLVLSELDYGFKVENFTRDNLSQIERNWSNIKTALEKACRTVNLFGVHSHNLTSLNALMPIAYYFYRVATLEYDAHLVDSPSNFERIRRWLASALLNGIFGGTANVTVGMSRSILRDETAKSLAFPAMALVSQMTKRGRSAEFDDDAIEKFLQIDYRHRLGFVALSLVYDIHDWGHRRFQKSSVFAADYFDEQRLISLDVPSNDVQAAIASSDRIPNLVLLSRDEYVEKSEMDFHEWVLTREEQFFRRHLLPRDTELYHPRNFMRFIAAREALISERLKSLFDFDDDRHANQPMALLIHPATYATS